MSLDVYLHSSYPCPHCGEKIPDKDPCYRFNITHNLGKMAGKAGIYEVMWRPDEIGVKHAKDAIPLLKAGIHYLDNNKDECIKLNPPNGWGSYDGLLGQAMEYLSACEYNPDTVIEVSR